MKASINIPLACALGILVSACGGGGGSSTSSGTQTSNLSTYTVSGRVPGTLIEAFCSDGSYYSVNSTDNGTAQHPFSLKLPKGVTCRLVMTTNENDPYNKVVTPIRVTRGASGNIAFTSDGSNVDMGYVNLAMSRSGMHSDSNGDGVEDSPLDVDVSASGSSVRLDDSAADPMDVDRDGIINLYEDDDGDQVPNKDDPDYMGSTSGNDSDHDGIDDSHDVDRNNDGVKENESGGSSSSSSSSGSTTGVGPSVFAPDAGRLLAAQCAQCHGTDGRSVSGIEGLAGEGGEIMSEMLEMQSSTSVSLMHKQAKGYTAAEIQAIGTYFSGMSGSNGGGSDD